MSKPLTNKQSVAVKLDNIEKSFPAGDRTIKVLKGIDLSLPAGEMVFLVGPSGCGKTTLISIAAGILTPDEGSQVTLFGTDIESLTRDELSAFRYNNVGFIFQQFNLVQTITVAENIAIPLLIQKKKYSDAINKAKDLLEKVGIGDKWDAFPSNLSGGQQQRVAIARALSNDPKLLICDEPTSSLDSESGSQVMEILKETATAEGRCVIIVTHDNRIFNYADRMVKMEDGLINDVLTGDALAETA